MNSDNPLYRFRAFLVARGWWSEAEEAALLKKNKSEVLKTFSRAEKLPKPKLGEMFNDVWAVQKGEEMPSVIVSDAAQNLSSHLAGRGANHGLERTKGRTGEVVEEIRRRLGAVEKGEEAVRRRGRGRDGLRWEGSMSQSEVVSYLEHAFGPGKDHIVRAAHKGDCASTWIEFEWCFSCFGLIHSCRVCGRSTTSRLTSR